MIRRLVPLVPIVLVASSAFAIDAQFSRHPVSSVPDADRIVVVYAGLPVTVRLAHIALPAKGALREQARSTVQKLVKGKTIRAAYCPEAGLDEYGLPYVYVSAGTKIVNEVLVRRGFARYDDGGKPSKYYRVKMASADRSAQQSKAGIWASGAVAVAARPSAGTSRPRKPPTSVAAAMVRSEPAGVVYSELNSSQFHLPTCRWAKQMSPQRRIRYKSLDSAEKAGKRPCWLCLPKRAKSVVFGGQGHDRKVKVVPGRGPLVVLDGVLHAANCEKALAKTDECVSARTPKEALSAGATPCELCLRLAGDKVPLPEKGECIGRAPPHRRPCRRAPADESGLCLYCQGKE